MTDQTSIIMNRLDLERLERLLDSDENRRLPGIESLWTELSRATVVDPADVPSDVVTMNSTVRFVDDSNGSEFQLTLVYPHAAGVPGTFSILAPVGSALLGLAVGQPISWQVPGGRKLQLRVLAVLHQPEAMGQLHR